ncbi:MAG: hypothetical protein QXY47_07275 [Thermoplasmata archaeon]
MSAYLNQKFGFIDPLLYQIGPNATNYSLKPFFDVTQNPPGYHNPAKVGWDFPSGWGTFYAWNFTQIVKGSIYTVTFTESGLPSGTPWVVTFGGYAKSSTTNTISFTGIANGTYSYTIATSDHRYGPLPSSGSFTVNGKNVNQAITFTASTSTIYTVKFTESGLPSGTIWYVNLSNGQSFSSATNRITFNEPNGTYSYKVETANKNYNPFPMNRILNLNNNNITIHFKNSGYPGYLFLIGGVLILTALFLIAIFFRNKKKKKEG